MMNANGQMKSHVSHAEIEDHNGKIRKWWRLDFASPKGAAGTLGALLVVLGVLWGIYATITVSVLDPHIRAIVREEVPKAMMDYVDNAVEKAAKPHMDVARMEHANLQAQIDVNSKAIVANREEREKFQHELAQHDAEQAATLERVEVKIDGLYEYLLAHKVPSDPPPPRKP